MISKKFLLAGSACALFTVITTLIVHLVQFPASTFDERLLLSNDTTYITRNVLTILHCIAVAISMGALAHARRNKAGGSLMTYGAVAFLIFSITEIVRMLLALIFINGLRKQYLSVTDEALRDQIKFVLEFQWPLANTVLFTLFILAFGFGCLFMGLGMIDRSKKFDRIFGLLFVFWSVQSFVVIGNNSLGWNLDTIIFWLSITFQPAMRATAAIWLFKESQLNFRTQVKESSPAHR